MMEITMRESILTQREMDLIREYEEALVQDYDSPREENQVLGEIYLELVEVRTDLAETQGYDNYADYAYEAGILPGLYRGRCGSAASAGEGTSGSSV